MRGILKDAWFIHHLDWYIVVEGVGYVPTEKAPPEAVEAMKRMNELTEDEIV